MRFTSSVTRLVRYLARVSVSHSVRLSADRIAATVCLILPLLAHADVTATRPVSATRQTVSDWCPRLVARLPKVTVADCRASRLQTTGVLSNNGFPIVARDFSASAKAKTPIRVLLIGGIHGDEMTAMSIVFKWMDWMQKPGAQDMQWKVVPVLNPDGLMAKSPTRVNAHGVDLNRNFPTPNWAKEAPAYWAKTTRSDPRRYPGPAPVSEPESRWVYDMMGQFKPDVIISVHAPYGVLDMDGPAKPPSRFGRLMFNRVGVYPGSLGNYSGVHQDIPVVTIELANARTMPSDAEVQRIWQDMLSWIHRNVPVASKAGNKVALAKP